MPARGLDFLAIGPPKVATTSLHEYLRTHPALFLPEAKEQPFFTRDVEYEAGWEQHAAVAFRGAPPGCLLGKVSAQYLGGPASWREGAASGGGRSVTDVTAARIAEAFPDVKLIVMLRDPVERAISSYWQCVVIGSEDRTIDDAFAALLEPRALEAARLYPEMDTQYLALSEYGRLIEGYLRHFPRQQLFVGATATLAAAPDEFLRSLYGFLGVDPDHIPSNLGQRFQTRGAGHRSRFFTTGSRLANEAPVLRQLWAAVPGRARTAIRARARLAAHRSSQRARSSEGLEGRPSDELIARMRELFEPDLVLLERIAGPVPGVTPASA